jgi:anti-repressor protein
MNELIKISLNENQQQVVSARDLYRHLEVKTEFPKWCNRMFEYGFEDGKDYIEVVAKKDDNLKGGSNTLIDYALKLDMAKELSMIQRTEKGKQARLYFIECEKLNNAIKDVPLVQKELTRKELALMVIQVEEEKEQLLLQVDNLSTALDTLVEWVSILKVANFNKVSEKLFNWRLLKNKSTDMGFSIKRAESARFGFQNLYHINSFKACYPQFRYNFLNR